MSKRMTTVVIMVGVLGLSGARVASAQVVDDAQFKCEAKTNKAGPKFVGSKSKCIQKCSAAQWKAEKALLPTNWADCFPPYGGATLCCIDDSQPGCLNLGKGAENKFAAAIKKSCNPTLAAPKLECPACYSGGDCSDTGEATNRVQNIEGQVDSFVPGVLCESAGADKAEQKCQTNVAKVLSKQVKTIDKCFDACFANARKGIGMAADCEPNPSLPNDATAQACIGAGDTLTIAAIDKLCKNVVPNANPDCGGPDMYSDGAAWTNLVDNAIEGNIAGTYCDN